MITTELSNVEVKTLPAAMATNVPAKGSEHSRKSLSKARRYARPTTPEGESGEKPAKKPSIPAQKATGKASKHAGQVIRAEVKENPRRPGSWGYKSFDIVLKAGTKGISYEDYRKAGGRPNDLAWDLDHKYLSVNKPTQEAAPAKPKTPAKPKAPKVEPEKAPEEPTKEEGQNS